MRRIFKASAFAAFLILVDVQVDYSGSDFVGLGRVAKSGVRGLLLKENKNPKVVTEC